MFAIKKIIKSLIFKKKVAKDDLSILLSGARTKHLSPYNLTLPVSHLIPKDFIRQEPWEIEYLFMLAKRAKSGILETGRWNGGSALVFKYANKNIPIYSIDIAPQNDTYFLTLLQKNNLSSDNLHLIVGDSQNSKYAEIKKYDLLFIDGDHSYNGCLNDLKNWFDGLEVGGHVVLHDCYFGCEVQDAVLDFTKDKNVRFFSSPYIPSYLSHKRLPNGSLCHFQKLGNS